MSNTREQDAADQRYWLEQGLFLYRRVGDTGPDLSALSLWTNAFVQQSGYLPPLGMIWDLALLLLETGHYRPTQLHRLFDAYRQLTQCVLRTPSLARTSDLFDLRFSENELLFYTRDDSNHSRKSQLIVFALLPDLLRARFKDRDLGWQRLTLVMALIQLCVSRLGTWLADDGLSFELLFVLDRHRINPLAEESTILGLLLDDWITRGMLTIQQST
jgi:hypothetical protein